MLHALPGDEYQLEDELESKLHGTRATHLIERTQDAQRTRQCSRGLPKSTLAELRVDGSEIRVIEDVESFGAELQFQPLMDRKIPTDSQVHLQSPKKPCEVPGSIAETGIYSGEGIWINCPSSRTLLPWLKISQTLKNIGAIGAVEINWLARNEAQSPIVDLPIWL